MCIRDSIHSATELSPYVPRDGHEVPEPEWKTYDVFREVLPGTSDA